MNKLFRSIVMFCSFTALGAVFILILTLSQSCTNKTINSPQVSNQANLHTAKASDTGCNDFCGNPMPCDCYSTYDSTVSPIVCTIICPSVTPTVSPSTSPTPPASAVAISVDASDENNTKVNYQTVGTLTNVTFSAPRATASNPSENGSFSFTFNEHNLALGTNQIILNASNMQSPIIVTATRNQAQAPPLGLESTIVFYRVPVEDVGLVLVGLNYEILEQYNLINYSINVLPGGKTIWVGNSFVNLYSPENPNIPSEISGWTEDHYYLDSNGEHLLQSMADYNPDPAFVPSLNFESKNSTNNSFFAPGLIGTFEGVGEIKVLAFDDPGGAVMAFPSGFPATNPVLAVPIQ